LALPPELRVMFASRLGSGLLLLTPALKDSYVSIFQTLKEEFGIED
jgi:hypothetical protein